MSGYLDLDLGGAVMEKLVFNPPLSGPQTREQGEGRREGILTMFTLLVGFLIRAAVMWLARMAALRDYALQKWEDERASLKDRLRDLEAAAREVVEAADEQPWDPAWNGFWHAVDRLVEELEREQ